jgi:hypothetical protein
MNGHAENAIRQLSRVDSSIRVPAFSLSAILAWLPPLKLDIEDSRGSADGSVYLSPQALADSVYLLQRSRCIDLDNDMAIRPPLPNDLAGKSFVRPDTLHRLTDNSIPCQCNLRLHVEFFA